MELRRNGDLLLLSWHPPFAAPDGRPHCAAEICVTGAGDVVLISNDGESWDLPGGRPEGSETWEETLRREVLEEACVTVSRARLLGFARSLYVEGPEAGDAIVRSLWRADVEVGPWEPEFEVSHRRIVAAEDALDQLTVSDGIYARIFPAHSRRRESPSNATHDFNRREREFARASPLSPTLDSTIVYVHSILAPEPPSDSGPSRQEPRIWLQLYNPMKGGGGMVISNQNVNRSSHPTTVWGRVVNILHQWLVIGPAHSLRAFTEYFSDAAGQRTQGRTYDGIVRYISIPQRQPDFLLERSDLLFRRDNQGESFDDDVSALRDQVGSSRRDQPDEDTYQNADQTTYSPPGQSWNTTTSAPAQSTYSAPAADVPTQPVPEAGEASVIAADTTWDGTVQSSGSLHVYGAIGGQITADGDIYVAEGASVSANVRAGSMTIAGSIEGNIECSGRFEVLPTGRVTADVTAPRLVVHEGAVVAGKLSMTSDTTGRE